MSKYGRKEKVVKYLVYGIIAVIFMTAFGALAFSYNDCNKQDGTLVKGVFWYTCIQSK